VPILPVRELTEIKDFREYVKATIIGEIFQTHRYCANDQQGTASQISFFWSLVPPAQSCMPETLRFLLSYLITLACIELENCRHEIFEKPEGAGLFAADHFFAIDCQVLHLDHW